MAVYIEWECDEADCPETVKMKTSAVYGVIHDADRWAPPGMRWVSLDPQRYPNGQVLCDKHYRRAMDAFNKAKPGAVWIA